MVQKKNQNLGPMIKVANNLIEKELNNQMRALFIDFQLTGPQVALLVYLFENQEREVSQKELEIKFTISHPTIRSIVKRLVQQQLLSAKMAKYDKRQVILALTNNSKEMIEDNIERIYLIMNKVNQKITAGLSNTQQMEFLSNLNQIISNFQ